MQIKARVSSVSVPVDGHENITLMPVVDPPAVVAEGEEAPPPPAVSGHLQFVTNHPDLIGKFAVGQEFSVDFSPL